MLRHNGTRLLSSVALALVLGLSGCAQQQQQSAPAAEEAATVEESQETTVATDIVAPDFAEATVSYLGPEGTYTEEAAKHVFDDTSTLVTYDTVPNAVAALVAGESTFAVIPQENTIGGPVTDYIDCVLDNAEVTIKGEIELPISQNLLGLPGAKLSDIKHVYSHKQGIAQGKAWLAENLPEAEVEEVSSTAEGARMVSEGANPTTAAICSAGCAEVYGLEILAPNIHQNDDNVTRFYVLSTEGATIAGSQRMAFVATGAAADFPSLMSEIQAAGLNLVTCNNRPAKDVLGRYRYLIEVSPADQAAYEKIAATQGFDFRFLGGFDLH
jgi:prephenate dehydratase